MYPIHKLDRNIVRILQDIISADIKNNINRGLKNKIDFIDKDGHITDVAKVVPNIVDNTYSVKLSSAFCQFFWLMSFYCLREIDMTIIKEECFNSKITLEKYKTDVEKILQQPYRYITLIELYYPGISSVQYIDYLRRSLSLLDEKRFACEQKKVLQAALSILNTNECIDKDAICGLNLDGLYEQKVNSVYCFGIAFILLHELSHFALGHFSKHDFGKDDEGDADMAAFWSIYSDVNNNFQRFSAYVGIFCMMFSLLMINSDFSEDDSHPREDKRIFAIYDQIKEENHKYTVLLIRLFNIWAEYYKVKDYPSGLSDDERSLERIRSFLSKLDALS